MLWSEDRAASEAPKHWEYSTNSKWQLLQIKTGSVFITIVYSVKEQKENPQGRRVKINIAYCTFLLFCNENSCRQELHPCTVMISICIAAKTWLSSTVVKTNITSDDLDDEMRPNEAPHKWVTWDPLHRSWWRPAPPVCLWDVYATCASSPAYLSDTCILYFFRCTETLSSAERINVRIVFSTRPAAPCVLC